MPELLAVTSESALARIRPGATIAAITPEQLRRHAPDAALALVGSGAALLARASCWWASTPSLPGRRVGLIGHYAAEDDDSAAAILDAALGRLREQGCDCAVGPMDGNTWRPYRFVVEPGTEPPFFLEPANPPEWPRQFARAGFSELATYSSAVAPDLTAVDPRLPAAEGRLADAGVTIRPLRLDRADEELAAVFRLSLSSFAGNFLYTPLTLDEFLEQNRRILPVVHPELVLLAERGGALAGFAFAVPDVLAVRRAEGGRKSATYAPAAIVKTVAVTPDSAHRGLGSVLVGRVHRRAHELGFSRAIHALMHDANVSTNISARYATVMRRYALFVADLCQT